VEFFTFFCTFRSQLILKQEQLEAILSEAYSLESNQNSQEEGIDYIELEELEREPDDQEFEDAVTLPSIKNLANTTDNESIARLIDEIEEKNEIILQNALPPSSLKKRKARETRNSARKKLRRPSPAARNEELKFEVHTPKLIIRPVLCEDRMLTEDEPGVIMYSVDNKCDTCEEKFSTISQLKRHQHALHPLETSTTCCDQVFNLEADHKKHLELAHPKTVECHHCGKVLKNKKTFMVHMRSHQTIEERKFKCNYPDCGKAFNFKLHLENHERTHSGKLHFPDLTSLTASMFVHQESDHSNVIPAPLRSNKAIN
jgi:Zinc finger, C2H2 type